MKGLFQILVLIFIQLLLARIKKPIKTFGKPSLVSIKSILQKHNLNLDEVVMIGDRLYTDIDMGKNNEMTTILVLTGETKRQDLPDNPSKPDIVVDNVWELIEFI